MVTVSFVPSPAAVSHRKSCTSGNSASPPDLHDLNDRGVVTLRALLLRRRRTRCVVGSSIAACRARTLACVVKARRGKRISVSRGLQGEARRGRRRYGRRLRIDRGDRILCPRTGATRSSWCSATSARRWRTIARRARPHASACRNCNQRSTAPHGDPSCTARLDVALIARPSASSTLCALPCFALLVRRQSHGCDESGHYRYAEAEVAMYRMSELKLVERQHQR